MMLYHRPSLFAEINTIMKFCSIALLASSAAAFAPPHSISRYNPSGFSFKSMQQPHLRLLPDPSLTNEITNIVADSAFSSSSITTSNFIDGLVSNVGGLVLIASVGAGVYSTALQEKQQEFQKTLEDKFSKDTGDDFAAPVVKESAVKAVAVEVEEPAVETPEEPVVEEVIIEEAEEIVEEMSDITGEALATTPAPTPVPPTSELVLKETEKAIAEVKAKGVQETKAKMSFNESVLTTPSAPEPVEDVKKEVAKKEKDPGTKKQIAQGVTLIVAAVGVALARNVIKAWLGRGMF